MSIFIYHAKIKLKFTLKSFFLWQQERNAYYAYDLFLNFNVLWIL